MKYFIILVLAQIALAAPNGQQPNIADQIQTNIAAAQKQASEAVQALQKKVLETTGAKTNVELISRFDEQASTYGNQLKEITSRIADTASSSKSVIDEQLKGLANSLSESAAKLLAGNDPNKQTQLQDTYKNVLTQTESLQSRFSAEGENIQKSLGDLFSTLLENTRRSAIEAATKLDEATAKP